MATITLKRTTVLLFTLVFMEMCIFGNLVFTNQSAAAITTSDKLTMTTSDIDYAPEQGTEEFVEEVIATEDPTVLPDPVPEEEPVAEPEQWTASYQPQEYTPQSYDTSDVSYGDYVDANLNGEWHSAAEFAYNGTYTDASKFKYTYYSENVLPGGGLDIPGRHLDKEGYVVDANDNICIASKSLEKGTVVSVPFGSGTGIVYDVCENYGVLDVYTSW